MSGRRSAAVEFGVATVADAPAIVALVDSAYRGELSRAGWTTEADLLGGQRTDRDAVETLIGTPSSTVLLATTSDDLVGCCHVQGRGGGTEYLGMLAVKPTQQGRGIGARILAEAERRSRDDWSGEWLRITVIGLRLDLIVWYERIGFARTGETEPFPYGEVRFGIPTRHDLAFVVLEKQLGPDCRTGDSADAGPTS